MSERQISVHDRVNAIDQLEGVADYLNSMASWLSQHALVNEADAVNEAAKSLLASCWWLSRPLNPKLPPRRWQQPQQQPAQDGRP